MNSWSEWIGREERASDTSDAGLARRWLGTFDLAQDISGPLPQSAHWCLAVPDLPSARLGPDGHPARDGGGNSFLPPIPLERRMWAGSTVDFLAPIPVGAEISRLSRVAKIEEKEGRSGALVFATVEHEWVADGMPAVREVQSLVYREAPSGPSAPAQLPTAEVGEWDAVHEFTPDAPLLFRYSALTFNTHRIHYDADYVRDVEHYPGLVVHGPLTATRLLLLAARELGGQALTRFAFRALSPAYAGEKVTLGLRRAGENVEFAAFAGSGPHGSRRIMEASGVLA